MNSSRKYIIALLLITNTIISVSFSQKKLTDKTIWGIDLSHHQRNINWNGFNNNTPDFVFLKATEGTTHKDSKYKEYKKKFDDLGITTGSYHFFSYQSKGRKQATEYLKFSNLKKGDLIPVLDCEYKSKMPSKEIVTKELIAFIKQVKKEIGIYPIIYCECSYYQEFLAGHLNKKPIRWISDYKNSPSCQFTIWQTTNKFKHPAFTNFTDYNVLSEGTSLNEITIK